MYRARWLGRTEPGWEAVAVVVFLERNSRRSKASGWLPVSCASPTPANDKPDAYCGHAKPGHEKPHLFAMAIKFSSHAATSNGRRTARRCRGGREQSPTSSTIASAFGQLSAMAAEHHLRPRIRPKLENCASVRTANFWKVGFSATSSANEAYVRVGPKTIRRDSSLAVCRACFKNRFPRD